MHRPWLQHGCALHKQDGNYTRCINGDKIEICTRVEPFYTSFTRPLDRHRRRHGPWRRQCAPFIGRARAERKITQCGLGKFSLLRTPRDLLCSPARPTPSLLLRATPSGATARQSVAISSPGKNLSASRTRHRAVARVLRARDKPYSEAPDQF